VYPVQEIEDTYYALIPHADKFVHLVLYTFFAFVAYLGYNNKMGIEIQLIARIILYGMIIEFMHLFIPYRAFEWQDILANTGGTAFGIIFAIFLDRERFIR
jgi:VanZ family protein